SVSRISRASCAVFTDGAVQAGRTMPICGNSIPRAMPERLPQTDFDRVLRALTSESVDFILIGGLAAIIHGSARTTYDVDVVYARAPANLARIVKALAPFQPYLRGVPPGLPFHFDERTLRNGLNFTLLISIGGVDLLGEVLGGGSYDDLL